MLGGQVGINNHVTIGDGAQIAARERRHGDVPRRRALGRHSGQAGQAMVPRDYGCSSGWRAASGSPDDGNG